MPRCSLWHSFSAAPRANNGGLFLAILCCNLDFITPLTQGPTAGEEAGQMRVVSFFLFFFWFCFVLFFFPTCQQPRTPNALSLSAQQYPSACVPPTNNPHPTPFPYRPLPATHFKPMRQVNNIIEGTLFGTSESILRCDGGAAGVGYLWHPLSSWEQTSLGAAKADNVPGQRDLGICHTVLQVITRTDKLLSRRGLMNSELIIMLMF